MSIVILQLHVFDCTTNCQKFNKQQEYKHKLIHIYMKYETFLEKSVYDVPTT